MNFFNAGAGPESMMIVRRTHNHAVHVFIRRSASGTGIVVTRIMRSKGCLPDTDDLVGPVYHSRKAIRSIVLHRMKRSIINQENL